jgi:hypothetical protein
MAKSILVNSAEAEKPFYASRILYTCVNQGYAALRVSLIQPLTQCSPSLTHEYLWALSERLEHIQTDLDDLWQVKLRALEKGSS